MRRLAKASSAGSTRGLGALVPAAVIASFLLLAVLFGAAPAAQAAATTAHPLVSTFNGAETPTGSFESYFTRVGIDEGAGRVYVADATNGVIDVFDTDGKYISRITAQSAGIPGVKNPFETIPLAGPIAVDNSGTASDGRVYVSVRGSDPERGRIYAFDAAGKYVSTIDGTTTPDGFFAGTPTDLVVDSVGRLYVADASTGGSNPTDHFAIAKFDSSGNYLSQFSTGTFPGSIAVDSAFNVYVYKYYRQRVDKYGPSGSFIATLDSDHPTSVAVNPSDDHVYVGTEGFVTEYDEAGAFVSRFGFGRVPFYSMQTVDGTTGRIYDHDGDHVDVYAAGIASSAPDVEAQPATGVGYFEATLHGTVDPLGEDSEYFFQYRAQGGETWVSTPVESAGNGSGPLAVSADLSGIRSGTTYEFRLIGISADDEASTTSAALTFETDPVPPPVVTIDPVSSVTGTSAHFSGTFDPEGVPTSARFEYRSDSGEWTALAEQGPEGGTSPIAIEADLKGLVPNTTYHVKLVASNPGASASSPELTFATPSVAPLVYTGGAAPRTETTARLNGWLTTRNTATTYYFEFGPTDSYGTELPVTKDAAADPDVAQIAVSAQVDGLAPGATYHFRLVAENAGGKTVGDDQAFQTRTAAEAGPLKRGVELVSAPEKGNQPIGPIPYVANDNASRILWTTLGGAPGGPTGSGNEVLADRGPDGWHSRSLLPPASQLVDNGGGRYIPRAVDPAFRDFAFEVSSGILTAPERTIVTLDDEGRQRILGPTGKPNHNGIHQLRANDDLSHVYTNTEEIFDPVRHPAGSEQVYDFSTNPPTLATVMPDGLGPKCGVVNEVGFSEWAGGNQYEWVSTDAGAPARFFFESRGSEQPCPSEIDGSKLFMRDLDAETTTLISGPALPGGNQTESAQFVRASDDGSEVVFAAISRLTPEDTNDAGDLYKYTLGEGPECLTCVGDGGGIGVGSSYYRSILASNDLSYIYFSTGSQLLPDVGPQGGIYRWHDGEIRYVGPSGSVFAGLATDAAELTDGGRVLVFRSNDPQLTTDETDGTPQVYRYDDLDHSVECISCLPGGMSTTEASLASSISTMDGFGTSAERGDDVVFATKEAIDPRDINADTDIYEWRNGKVGIVTDGVSQYPPGIFGRLILKGVGNDGTNVVFSAGINLTGYERDNVGQLYVARVGGGFPPPPPPPAPCGEESCQGPLQAPPSAIGAASAAHGGPGNVKEGTSRKKKKRCASGKVRKRAGKCTKSRSKQSSKKRNSNKQGGKR